MGSVNHLRCQQCCCRSGRLAPPGAAGDVFLAPAALRRCQGLLCCGIEAPSAAVPTAAAAGQGATLAQPLIYFPALAALAATISCLILGHLSPPYSATAKGFVGAGGRRVAGEDRLWQPHACGISNCKRGRSSSSTTKASNQAAQSMYAPHSVGGRSGPQGTRQPPRLSGLQPSPAASLNPARIAPTCLQHVAAPRPRDGASQAAGTPPLASAGCRFEHRIHHLHPDALGDGEGRWRRGDEDQKSRGVGRAPAAPALNSGVCGSAGEVLQGLLL